MLLKERVGNYRGKAKIKNFITVDLDLEASINENGDITINTMAPIVGKVSHTLSLGSYFDSDIYEMDFNGSIFLIKFNDNKFIEVNLPEKINGSLIITRDVILYRVK